MYRRERRKQHIRRTDIFLIGISLVAAAVLALFFFSIKGESRFLQISYNGEVLETLKLGENILQQKDVYYLFLFEHDGITWEKLEEYPEIPGNVSFNLLWVSPGNIRMEAADCRDQICVNHMPIAGGGENIICLPHRLVVEIQGRGDEEAPDGMVK